MEKKNYKVRFFTPAFREETSGEAFGACSLGIAFEEDYIEPVTPVCAEFFTDLEGYLLCGRLETVRNELAAVGEEASQIKAGIILFGNCGGENGFVNYVQKMFPGLILAGGSAAFGDDGITGRLLPQKNQVSILLITDDRYDVRVDSVNIHHRILAKVWAIESTPRKIESVMLEDGTKIHCYDFIQKLFRESGYQFEDCGRMSVSTAAGHNIHLIMKDRDCFVGADLPDNGEIYFRATGLEEGVKQIREFYESSNSIIFGCAGLKTLLEGSSLIAGSGSIGLFMFGEIAEMENNTSYANLMLTRIRFTGK